MRYFLWLLVGMIAPQTVVSQKKIRLPAELNEISGLERYNDSILIAINDSGNAPELFFIDLAGKILKKCHVSNASNSDWEDLAMDDSGNLFIADVGNNLNSRKDLCIWKLRCEEAFIKDSITAERISFFYADQTEFPPNEANLRFDCEAIYWMNDTLHLITKNTSKRPKDNRDRSKLMTWNRFPGDYVISDEPGNYHAQQFTQHIPYLHKVKSSGIRDLVTAADYSNGVIAILTYSELRTIPLYNSGTSFGRANGRQSIRFPKLEQREAIVILSEKVIAVASEKHPLLGGPFLAIFTVE